MAVRIAHLESELAELKAECRQARAELKGVREFQVWMTGAVAAIGVIGGLFLDQIKVRLGL